MTHSVRDPEFYLSHSGYVRALARQLVFDEHAAEHISQETWLAALARPPRDASSPRRWLKALVRNLALSAWLRDDRRGAREAAVEREPVSTPGEVVEHELARRRVVEALLEIEEPYRSTLIRRYFGGLEPREIAAELGLPVETVRTRVKRGLERLRARMGRDRAWSLLLVRQLRLEPSTAAVLGSTLRGILIMSAVKKGLVVGAAVVVLLASLWWTTREAAAPAAAASARTVESVAHIVHIDATPATTARAPAGIDAPRSSDAAIAAPKTASTTGSLALHVVWADDRTAAADVALNVASFSFQNVNQQAIDTRTDARGDVRLGELPPGELLISLDRGVQCTVVIEPGATTEKTLEIPQGVDVDGVVRDIDGRGFEGADIGLAWMSNNPLVVARSRADGTFSIRAVQAEMLTSVSARAAGRAPTMARRVQGSVGSKVSIELAFTADGGGLSGRVVDAGGAAVPHAVVLVGFEGFELELQRGGAKYVPSSQRVIANERGEFLFPGVAEGFQPLQVGAQGFAPWRSEVEIVRGHVASREIVLERGTSLAGLVRDGDGAPLRDVAIQVGKWGFAAARVTTREDGSYELDSLPNAAFEANAIVDTAVRASAQLTGASGATLRWDPVLTKDRVLHGRIAAPGHDLEGWSVQARAMDWRVAQFAQDATSGADGRFEITNCPDAPLHIEVRSPTSSYFALAVLEYVEVTDTELVITPDFAREPSATLTGRVLDPEGKPIGSARVDAFPDIGSANSSLSAAGTGRFESERVPPGNWRLQVAADGFAARFVAGRRVERGDRADFGDIALERGGSIVARVRCAPGAGRGQLAISAFSDFGCVAAAHPVDGVARFDTLGTGRYHLVTFADDAAIRAQPVDVVDGRESQVDCEVVRGVDVLIAVLDSAGRPLGELVEFELRDAAGFVLNNATRSPEEGGVRWSGRLAAGHHSFAVRDLRGHTGRVEFEVPAETAEARFETSVRLE